ncbi:MAG: metallopeptidase family protein [Parcubacteria group bacterium]
MDREQFEQYITEAINEVPERLREKITNVAFVIEDDVRAARTTEYEVKTRGTLLGLYQGIPLSRRGVNYGSVLPDKITLFKNAIERVAGADEQRIRKLVRDVVHHEIGHYFGIDEHGVRKLERKRRKKN